MIIVDHNIKYTYHSSIRYIKVSNDNNIDIG